MTTEALWALFLKHEKRATELSYDPQKQLAAATMANAVAIILAARQ